MFAKRSLIVLLIILGSVACGYGQQASYNPLAPANRLEKAEKELSTAQDGFRLLWLGNAAMACLDLNKLEQAGKYADELAETSKRIFPEDGDADSVHKLNIILGRLELRHGNIEEAKSYLLKAAGVKGSPVLGSFGPNMTLAKELLEKDEREAVLTYLQMCSAFWEMHTDDTLKQWIQEVNDGKTPDFRANLYY